jgi:hypothetical protein
MGERADKVFDKIGSEEFKTKYQEKWVPRISKLGTLGKWWNKWHDPKILDGKVCPICVVRKNGADCLPQMSLVASSKFGQKLEKKADDLTRKLINYKRRPLS